MVPVTTTQLFRCGSGAAADGPEMNGHGWVPAKLFTNRLWAHFTRGPYLGSAWTRFCAGHFVYIIFTEQATEHQHIV